MSQESPLMEISIPTTNLPKKNIYIDLYNKKIIIIRK